VLPLDGITVVSLEQAVAAPFATRQLADLGARVIKVERPGVGDFARHYDESVHGESSYFVWLNRSKESLTLDIKSPKGLDVLGALLERADVFVQNLAPSSARRLGLGADDLQRRYPSLVVCDISGYGNRGPWAERRAYDLLVQSEAGLVSVTGTPEEVAKVGISVADIAGGMYAFTGILTALYQRATTGRATAVEVSLFDAMSEWMGAPAYYAMYSGRQPPRLGAHHATIAPYGPFQTGDGGSVMLGVQSEREWSSFCEIVLEDSRIAADERFTSNSVRVENRDALNQIIGQRFEGLDTASVRELLARAQVASAELNSMASYLEHPVLAERDRWREVDTPGGAIRALLPPVIQRGVEPHMGPVPALGQHTAPILRQLGYAVDDIDGLRAEGVV